MKCPVCRAPYRSSLERRGSDPASSTPSTLPCRRCGADLAPLVHLHDQAIAYHHRAIEAFQTGDYAAAIACNAHALSLYFHQADFHAFAGQLWALEGEFEQAIAAWKIAQSLDPKHPTAGQYLQLLQDCWRA